MLVMLDVSYIRIFVIKQSRLKRQRILKNQLSMQKQALETIM